MLDTLAYAPRSMLAADWGWDHSLRFDEISVTVTINNNIEYKQDNGLYLIGCTAFTIGGHGAYFGLQTKTSAGPDYNYRIIGKGAIFSVWDTPTLDGVRGPDVHYVESGSYEGNFLSVRIPYDWEAGKYTMRIAAEESDDQGRWFGYYVNDTWVGSLRFPPDAKIRPWCATHIEVYGVKVRPSEIPYWKVSILPPVGDGITADLVRTRYPANVESLINTLITVDGDRVTFEVGLDYIPEGRVWP